MIHRQILPPLLIAALFLCPALTLAQQDKAVEPNQKGSDTELKEKAAAFSENPEAQQY